MFKRILSLLLCVLFVASSAFLVACDKEEDTSGTSVGGSTDGFLNEVKKWNDTVTILGYNGKFAFSTCQIDPQSLTDEPVNDAFYNRNALINETFGIDIQQVLPQDGESLTEMLRQDITSGLGEYDAVVGQIAYVTPIALDDLLMDYNTITNGYLHLDQAWWDKGVMEDLDINNKVFFITGDAVVDDDENTWAMYFNKDMFSTNAALAATLGDYSSIYELVKDGKWTLDVMYEMMQTVELTSGSTKVFDPASDDTWGMVAQSYDFYLLMQGCGQRIVDASGDIPVLRVDTEENVDAFLKLCDVMYDDKHVGIADFYGKWNEGIYTKEREIFAAGKSLFMPGAISYVSLTELRDSEIHYGILPMPKRSELQTEYTTSMTVYDFPVISIPITNTDKLDLTCYALEAMAFYGKQIVTPEYYNRTLTYKRFEDTESEEMLDLIFRNRIYDMAAVFNFHGSNEEGYGTLYFYTNILWSKSRNIVSIFDRNKNAFQSDIDDLIALAYN